MLYVPFHSSALQCYDRFEGDGWNCSTLKEFNGRTQTEQTWQQKKHFEGHVHQATSKYLQHILSRIQIYIPIFPSSKNWAGFSIAMFHRALPHSACSVNISILNSCPEFSGVTRLLLDSDCDLQVVVNLLETTWNNQTWPQTHESNPGTHTYSWLHQANLEEATCPGSRFWWLNHTAPITSLWVLLRVYTCSMRVPEIPNHTFQLGFIHEPSSYWCTRIYAFMEPHNPVYIYIYNALWASNTSSIEVIGSFHQRISCQGEFEGSWARRFKNLFFEAWWSMEDAGEEPRWWDFSEIHPNCWDNKAMKCHSRAINWRKKASETGAFPNPTTHG